MEKVDLSVIIVNYNTKSFLENCLYSLESSGEEITIEVIVVDNGSSDGSPEIVRSLFPQVKLIANPDNYGFAYANNQGLRASRGRYCLLLNSDTEVRSNALKSLVDFMDSQPKAGACGPKILNPDGTVQKSSVRSFPNIKYLFYDNIGLTRIFPKSKIFGKYRMTYWSHNALTEVDQPAGACLLVKREIIEKVGLLDEQFFVFYEDVDWCYRIKKAGWKIYFVPNAEIIHYGGQSGSQFAKETFIENYRSLHKFFRKYHGCFYVLLINLILYLGLFLRILAITFMILTDAFKGKRNRSRFWQNRKQMLEAHVAVLLQNWRL